MYIYIYKLIHIFLSGLSVSVSCSLQYNQNDPVYLIQNMIHHKNRIFYSMLKLIYQIYCFYMSFYIFLCILSA